MPIFKSLENRIRALHPMRRYIALKKHAARMMNSVRLKGNAVFCPCCDHSALRFLPNDICAFCESRPRQRFLWLYLQDRLQSGDAILHFAPEPCLQTRLRNRIDIKYLSADIASTFADVLVDLNAPDEFQSKLGARAYSKIILSHVLEHIPDDALALRLLKGLLTREGELLIQVPQDLQRAETYEDWTITTPAERLQAFGQEDHVRLYGRDLPSRLAAAGFQVLSINPQDHCSSDAFSRLRLKDDTIFVCTKSPSANLQT